MSGAADDVAPSADLAEHAYGVLRRRFGSTRQRGLFHERTGRRWGRRPLAYNWTFSHAFAAAIDLHGIARGPTEAEMSTLVRALDRYWDARPRGGVPGFSSTVVRRGRGGAKFYDDNAWCGLDLVRLHRIDPARPSLVPRALDVLEFAFDDYRRRPSNEASPCAPGGIHWQQQIGGASRDLGTVANAGIALLALRVFAVSGDERHLDLARALYSWTDAHLLDPSNGLYWDHVTPPDCHIDRTQWSYNQGLMLGVSTLLFRATADTRYEQAATRIATAALAEFGLERLRAEPVEFAVILFRNLLLWSAANAGATGAPVRERAEQYLRLVWPRFVTASTERGRGDRLIEHAAIVEMMAMLCWPPERSDDLA
jgi:hypothetical protein